MNKLQVASMSTAHLSLQTRIWLDGIDWKQEGPAGGDIGYGYFVYAHDDRYCSPSPAHAQDGEYPSDLWACFEAARGAGCSHIRFDSDEDVLGADQYPTLRTYDDEAAPVCEGGFLLDTPIIDLIQQQDGSWHAIEPHREDDANEYDDLEEAVADLTGDKITVRHTRHYEPAEMFA